MHMVNESIGVITSGVKPPTNYRFFFQINDEAEVKVGDYVEVPSGRYVLVGRVTLLQSHNEYFTDPNFIKDQMTMNISLKG